MINLKAIKDLFKPYELDFMDINDILDATGLSFKKMLRIHVEDECSKSIDESCMNYECDHNLVKMHDDETYVEVFEQVETTRKKDMKRVYGT